MIDLNPVIHTFPNGIRLVYLQREALVAHLGVMMNAGSRFEKEDEQGLAHFLEHCIFKGTKKRRAVDVLTDLDSVGGELNAYTNKEEMCIHASFRKNHFSIASELLADIIQNSTFPEKEISKEKEVVIDEINSYLDTPSERIFDEFEDHMFPNDPLGWNILGDKESVQSFTSDSLRRFKERTFCTDKMVISFVGNLPIGEVIEVIKKDFENYKTSSFDENKNELSDFETFNLSEQKANFQTHYLIGGRGPSYLSEERRMMTLLINILGGPALNARLNLKIREEYGYAYNVEAGYTAYKEGGYWSIYLGTDEKYLENAKEIVMNELASLCKNGLTQIEFEQGKEQLKGHIALSLDSNMELMLNQAKSLLVFNKIDNLEEIYNQIDSMENDEIIEISRKYFIQENIGELIYTAEN